MFEVTFDKWRFYESDFVLVHVASNLPSLRHLKSLRKLKPSWQLWIFFGMESPLSLSPPDTRLLNGMFDLTFTYRLDSDFWAPYGTYEEIPFVDLSQQDFSAGKDKIVAWIVSNCNRQLRKSVVHELQKYIAVDVFGSCSREFGESKSCSPGETCTSTIKRYKFFLAFENALCEDYITEKYWRHLGEENVVPVVMGGANYTKLAIPGSYINVLDFKTVKNLSDYLHYLDKNNTAYNEYFKWRQNFRPIYFPNFCSFCEVLTSESPKGIKNLTDFWVTQGKCSEKDLLVLNMWTRRSKLPAYFSILATFILITFILITLAVYFTQVYKVRLHV